MVAKWPSGVNQIDLKMISTEMEYYKAKFVRPEDSKSSPRPPIVLQPEACLKGLNSTLS